MSALTDAQVQALVRLADGAGAVALLEDLAQEAFPGLAHAIIAEARKAQLQAERAVADKIKPELYGPLTDAWAAECSMYGRAMLICGMLLVDRAQALALLGIGGAR